jgi:hypothetical protein
MLEVRNAVAPAGFLVRREAWEDEYGGRFQTPEAASGWGMPTTTRSSIPEKSLGLHVNTGSPFATAVAAIMASYARAAVLRPLRRSAAATCPNALAADASKGIGTKSVSACCKCAWRAARSWSLRATSGPTESSASVIALGRAEHLGVERKGFGAAVDDEGRCDAPIPIWDRL